MNIWVEIIWVFALSAQQMIARYSNQSKIDAANIVDVQPLLAISKCHYRNAVSGAPVIFRIHPLFHMPSSNIWDLIDLTRTNERKRFGSKRVKPRFEYKRNILLARNTYNQLIHIHFLSYEKHPGKKVLAWIFVRAVTIQFNLG